MWDASSGTQLLSLQGHDEAVIAVAFSANGQRIATASKDKTARLWDISPQLWLRRCCEIVDGLDEYYDDRVASVCDPCLNEEKCDVMGEE